MHECVRTAHSEICVCINKCLSEWALCAVTHVCVHLCLLIRALVNSCTTFACHPIAPGSVLQYSILHLLYITGSEGMGFA